MSAPESLGTKSAIVLGGSAGIGHAVVEKLIDEGFRVGVIARGADRLLELETRFAKRVVTASADVGDAAELDAAVDDLVAILGKPIAWVNCAMATSFSRFAQMQPDEFDRIVRTTFLGQVNGTRAAMRSMDVGKIVNVGSGLGYRPVPNQSAYCAAKHAINGFTGSVRSELMADDSRLDIALVQLPAVNTPQFDWARNRMDAMPQPAPPIFEPQVAANAVWKTITTDAREILVGESVLQLVFGDMVLPAFIDRKLAEEGVKVQKSDRPEPGGRPDNLFSPVAMPATAHGAYSDRAKASGVTVDADGARKAVFFGLPAATFVLGVVLAAGVMALF